MPTTTDDYISIVKSKLSTSNFDIVNVDLVPISETRLGYLGEHRILKISVKSDLCDEPCTLRFFVKSIPTNKKLKLFLKESKLWTREPLMYLSVLKDLQSQVNYKLSPRCFLARPDEIIILEDLTSAGYRMNQQQCFLDFEHCKVALECLASFHSASIIFEEKNNVRLDKLYPEIIMELLDLKPEADLFRRASANFAKTFQKLFDNHLTEISIEHKDRIISLIISLSDLCTPSTEFRNVVNHKDLWNNNFMFSYGKDGQPEKACLLDFQLSKYAPPGYDVMLLLHLNTTQQFRSHHEQQLLDHYYQHFSDQLHYAGLDSNKLLSRHQFSITCQQAMSYALISALGYFTVIVKLPPIYAASIVKTGTSFMSYLIDDSTVTVEKAYQESEQYRQSVMDSIQEVVQFLA